MIRLNNEQTQQFLKNLGPNTAALIQKIAEPSEPAHCGCLSQLSADVAALVFTEEENETLHVELRQLRESIVKIYSTEDVERTKPFVLFDQQCYNILKHIQSNNYWQLFASAHLF
ncbi:hypothetical protein PENTCL1PPCAC_18552 [Pristionchus entomophagus]|uniref:Uncharacterized protein n=1 Tax=Pristionchus entomophagus TaxID=358040 RepID=A0AAV5TQ99_9BILA|nr:hypothetical protein PENTCL1PPCAC_18552 [Pristionchus entomophagus]